MKIDSYSVCSCGAVTLFMEDGETYSVPQRKVKQFFPDLDLRSLKGNKKQDIYCCDYCVNHYGLDLCGCGSGERFGHCSNDLQECKLPMQKVDQYSRVMTAGSWLR